LGTFNLETILNVLKVNNFLKSSEKEKMFWNTHSYFKRCSGLKKGLEHYDMFLLKTVLKKFLGTFNLETVLNILNVNNFL
jgi:hypothetical protein